VVRIALWACARTRARACTYIRAHVCMCACVRCVARSKAHRDPACCAVP
jgi:hypothetical protein